MRIYVGTSEATYNAKRFKLNTICITKSTIANLRTFIKNTDFESFIGSVGSAVAHMVWTLMSKSMIDDQNFANISSYLRL